MSTYDMDELEAISDSTKSNNPNAARIAEKMMAKRQAARKRALKASFVAQTFTTRTIYEPSLPKLKFRGEK